MKRRHPPLVRVVRYPHILIWVAWNKTFSRRRGTSVRTVPRWTRRILKGGLGATLLPSDASRRWSRAGAPLPRRLGQSPFRYVFFLGEMPTVATLPSTTSAKPSI